MKLTDIQDTVQALSKSGIGIDDIGYSLFLFHQLPCKIVAHKVAESGSNSGTYYIEGNVEDFMSGYSYFWIEGRELSDSNIFQVDSSAYDSENLWTVVTVTESASYKVNHSDVGQYLCGRFSISDSERLKGLGGDIVSQMFEEGSMGNIAFDTFSFEINDEDRLFYDKVNKSGYFYEKDLITEIESVQSESEYSFKSGVQTTFLRMKNLYEFSGSDFEYGTIEFITGKSAGNKYVISYSNGYSFKVLGNLSKNYLNAHEYHSNVEIGDKVRIFKSSVFWVKFDIWSRSNLDEKFVNFSGKLDLSTVSVNDLERSLSVGAYSVSRDFTNHNLSSVHFDTGLNLTRLKEIKCLYMDSKLGKVRSLYRLSHPENHMGSINIIEVGFDVAKGWHILDYYPGGLFRFDLGKWYHVVDEGSFEKSTNSVFLASNEDSTHFDNESVLPDHSTDPTDIETIERKWHGGWCRITIDTEDAEFVGSTNRMGTNDGTKQFKKLSGLPDSPHKVMFYVNEDRTISHSDIFVYSFDNGEQSVPNSVFDLVLETDVEGSAGTRDVTYPVNFGSKLDANFADSDVMANYPYPWRYALDGSAEHVLQLYSFRKFNGIHLLFRNEKYDSGSDLLTSGYDSMITKFLQHMSIHFSNGTGWHKNISLSYAGGYANATGNTTDFVLNLIESISREGGADGEYGTYQTDMVGMRILCISGSNFGEVREITAIAQNAGDTYGTLLDVTTEAFSNNVTEKDRFVVINKNFNMKFLDSGDGFKDGSSPDVVSIFRPKSYQAGTYFTDMKVDYYTSAMDYEYVKPLNKLYIGHRSKFDSISLSLSNILYGNDDANDIAWFIKEGQFHLEYFNGLNWVPANNVVALPTTYDGNIDTSLNIIQSDDLLKYKILFEADDWHTGGYDHTQYAASLSQAPSDIDEDKIFAIRITFNSNMLWKLSNVSLSSKTDLNMVVMWDDIQGWAKNTVEVADGKYWVDTLQTAALVVDAYGIELQCRQSLTYLRQVKPVNKLESPNGNNFYFELDYNETDLDFENDIVMYSKFSENRISTIPRNISLQYFLKRILEYNGFKNNKDFRLHTDTFSDLDKEYLNIIGTKYDGIQPIDIGWDGAYVPELISDYSENIHYSTAQLGSCSALRDNGYYYLYYTGKFDGIKQKIYIFRSVDMKDWSLEADLTPAIISENFSIKVVKNRDDSSYCWYMSVRNYPDHNYLMQGTSSSPLIFPTTMNIIISSGSYAYGMCDVLHLKGVCSDTSDCLRFMCVVRYDGTDMGPDGPTNDPYLDFYMNEGDITDSADWVFKFTLAGALGLDPCFLKANYSVNDGTLEANRFVNEISMIFRGTDNKIYKTSPRLGDRIDEVWEYPNKISDTTITMRFMSCMNDGYTYNLLLDNARDAYTLIPTNRDCFLLFGTDSSDETKGICLAINDTIDDFNEDVFFVNKKQEMNEIDWFKSETEVITISDGVSTNGTHKRIYLGLRKPFEKILPSFSTKVYSDRLLVRYWDGITWQNIGRIYQNGRTIEDAKINPIFGFYFDEPINWVSDTFSNILSGFTYSGLDQKGASLYWIEISLPSGYASDKEIEVKYFRNAYTNVFMWKNRSLFILENWRYVKQIYTFNCENDKNIVIDSISFDKSKNTVLVNLADDNTYEYRKSETYLFDAFGSFKTSYPICTEGYYSTLINEFNFVTKTRPKHLVRAGYENQLTVSSIYRAFTIGGWDEDFMKELYGASSLSSGYPFIGYNIPVPIEQFLKKHSLRGQDWDLSDSLINNILIAKSTGISSVPIYVPVSPYIYSNSYSYLIGALSHSGLLWEELINNPKFKVPVGYYALLEKSYKTRYEMLNVEIQGILAASYPGAPSANQIWLIKGDEDTLNADFIDDNNSLLQYNGAAYTFSRPYEGMLIKDVSDSDQLYVWSGYKWVEIPDTEIWQGRTDNSVDAKIWLQWTVGQQGINLYYFRGHDFRPLEYLHNNTSNVFDKKILRSWRDLEQNFLTNYSFGGEDTIYIADNIKATCGVIVPDLASMKNSNGPTDVTEVDIVGTRTVKVQESNMPAIAFGMYAFKDVQNHSSVVRDDTTAVNPYAYSGIGLMKYNSKVKNWQQALFYDGSYTDITDNMNYKTLGNSYDISGTNYIYLGSESRFFAVTIAASSSNAYKVEMKNKDGSWTELTELQGRVDLFTGIFNKEYWSYKTNGMQNTFDPFKNTWQKTTIEGTEAYWIRIQRAGGAGSVRWAVLSGTMLWDNMVWWDDYSIESNNKPTGVLTDVQKRFFDTYIPMSIEYDIINKKLIGSFWNFDPSVNKYYPFRIAFDRSRLFNDNGEYYWSWDNQESIQIIDDDKYDYTYNIKDLATISHIDTKALLVDDSNPNKAAMMANIKSVKSGDSLFSFQVES